MVKLNAKAVTTKPKVYVTRTFFDEPIELLKTVADVQVFNDGEDDDDPIPRAVLEKNIADAVGLIPMLTDTIDATLLNHAPNLKIVANYAVGYNNISVADATSRGIMVTNTPDVLNNATADVAFLLLMAAARRLVEVDKYVRDGKWVRAWGPKMLLGSDISGGKTLGIMGMGRIGREMVPRARGFNMKVLYHNRTRLGADEEESLGVEYRSFDDLLREADFVSLHVPLGGATHHLIGERELRLMKCTAFLINTSRGAVVDEKALIMALQEKWGIAGAGLDVFEEEPTPVDNPLLKLDNVVVAPHIGSSTLETRLAMAMRAAENVVAVLEGERPRDLVNPEVLKRD